MDVLRFSPFELVNNVFNSYIYSEFPGHCFVYTDGSVFSNSAGIFVFIPNPPFRFFDCIPIRFSSFSPEGCTITQALRFIKSLSPYTLYRSFTFPIDFIFNYVDPLKSGLPVVSVVVRALITNLRVTLVLR